MAGSFIATVVQYSIAFGLGIAGTVESHVNDGGSNVVLGYRGAYWLAMGFASVAFFLVVLFIRDDRFDPKVDTPEETSSDEEPIGDKREVGARV